MRLTDAASFLVWSVPLLFRRFRVPIAPALLGVGFFVLYWRTLAPDVVGHDAGEFQFVPAIFGIPHGTGYPLYLLVGKAWSWLPLGSVAWRMNLLSALFGAGAVLLTAWAARVANRFRLAER